MRTYPALAAACTLIAFPAFVSAQGEAPATSMSLSQVALACAPPPAFVEVSRPALHVAGAQDTVARSVFDERDLLIVSGGTSNGVAVGQQYFARRPVRAPNYSERLHAQHPIHTAGWVRIVSTNAASSVAVVEHACGAIDTGDYLEPFVAPAATGDVPPVDNPADLDFGAMSRVMFGEDEHWIAGPGEFLLIDRGAAEGVDAGARVAIYRDVKRYSREGWGMRSLGLPLAAVADAVVVASGPSTAVLQVIGARDAVQPGDFIVPRRH
jgi:hypothetical protein